MKNLLKWEAKQTFSSKAFMGMGIALTAATLLMTLMPLSEDGYTGFDVFIHGCNNFNSFLIFFIGIFSAIHVTGAFEQRKIQAAIMAGNSRFSILSAKLGSFCLSVVLYSITALTASAVLAFSVKGIGGFEGSFFREVIVRIVFYSLIEASFASICFFLSMHVKNIGTSVTINLIALIGLNSVVQPLIGKEWADNLLKFTPVGQTFMFLADAGNKNLMFAVITSVMWLFATLLISYAKFRKEELK